MEANARNDAHEAEEKVTALIERAHTNSTKFERLWGEQDELHQTIEELHVEHDVAR
jgi:uncharacterized protein YigA (DUF484 family)